MIATKLLVNTFITSHIYNFVCGENFRDTIDQVIPFLGMYLETTIIQKRYMHPMFIATLFAVAGTWKQPKCPSAEAWIKMMYTYIQWNIIQ